MRVVVSDDKGYQIITVQDQPQVSDVVPLEVTKICLQSNKEPPLLAAVDTKNVLLIIDKDQIVAEEITMMLRDEQIISLLWPQADLLLVLLFKESLTLNCYDNQLELK